ncbi:hypothetical protein ACN38_g2276 [Penicillium nordicum]|uniref:DUF7587 domain-containing protein n=1 Tax=Penicillium nordicum TaxID=229535 RepID=A0A0M8PF07_9EURO|nr:hypothetical protein ACN38_g2276 [Penicillium nordicum]
MKPSLNGRYFYRCYSSASAGALRCGKYPDVPKILSHGDLLREFSNHMIRGQRVPTALISVTDRPIEALYRALEKYHAKQEDPKEIWIAIIFVPDDANTQPHHARKFAQQLMGSRDAKVFKHEYLFEWEIPRSYLKHNVSLRELFKGGRSIGSFLDTNGSFPGTLEEFRKLIMSEILLDAYGAGRWIGGIARAFGVRAPVYEIANGICSDSLGSFRRIDEDSQYFYVYWANDNGFHGGIEFGSICYVEDGISDELDS